MQEPLRRSSIGASSSRSACIGGSMREPLAGESAGTSPPGGSPSMTSQAFHRTSYRPPRTSLGPTRALIEPNRIRIKPKSNQNQIESNSNQNPIRILIEILGTPNKRIGNPRKSQLKFENVCNKSQDFLRSSQGGLARSARSARDTERTASGPCNPVRTASGRGPCSLPLWPPEELLGTTEVLGLPGFQDFEFLGFSYYFIRTSLGVVLGFYQILIWI